MRITFHRLSDRRHRVEVERADGSTEAVELDSKDFLRHDLAHLAIEAELGLTGGVWGSVAAGGSLTGDGLDGPDMALAERLAGPAQTLMRTAAPVEEVERVLRAVAPDIASAELAAALHERLRRLTGHWRATPFGGEMVLEWADPGRGPRAYGN
ncbi:MAG: hypothetical protein AAFZ07_19410 [Actinomycetota bacterium]